MNFARIKKVYEYNGVRGLSAISRMAGMSYATLWRRVNEEGMTIDQAVETPLDSRGRARTKPGDRVKTTRELLTEKVLRCAW